MRVFLFLGLMVGCLALLGSDGQAQQAQTGPEPVTIEWTVGEAPEGGWTVGDRIPLRLSVTYPPQMEVTIPELPAEWGAFEVPEQTLSEPVENENGTLTATREATVMLWSPGTHLTPPLPIRYRDAQGEMHEIAAPPLTLEIASVLSAGETEKRDLKGQISLPRPPVWPWVLGGLLLAALIGVAGWFLLTRLRGRMPLSAPASATVVDDRPPEEIAYEELDRIATLDLPAQGKLKRHYTLVTDCMRTYVQGRYDIPALDRTTQELTAAFRQARVDHGHASLLRALLTEADLVKFAKARPTVQQARYALAQARHIVDVTKAGDVEIREVGDSETRDPDAEPRIPSNE